MEVCSIRLVAIELSLPASLLFRCSCLFLSALLPIYCTFLSDLSMILTSADQHSAQTTHFLGKRRLFASHCQQLTFWRQKNTAADILTDGKEMASCGIYMLHELPQTTTKDCGYWNKVTCWTSKTGGTHSRLSSRTPSAYSRWVLWI